MVALLPGCVVLCSVLDAASCDLVVILVTYGLCQETNCSPATCTWTVGRVLEFLNTRQGERGHVLGGTAATTLGASARL